MPHTQPFTYATPIENPEEHSSPMDHFQIQRMVDCWAIWRDARWWDRIETLWHPEGRMVTTWGGLSSSAEFAVAAQNGYDAGDRMVHSNGGCTVDIVGNRAVSQTKLRIMQRSVVQGVLCDIVCVGRDYDFLEYRDGKWGFLLRQPIYERDWISPVEPDATLTIDPAVLSRYPEGYAHLGYIQSLLGYEINDNLPTHDNDRVTELYGAGERWLREGVIDWAI